MGGAARMGMCGFKEACCFHFSSKVCTGALTCLRIFFSSREPIKTTCSSGTVSVAL